VQKAILISASDAEEQDSHYCCKKCNNSGMTPEARSARLAPLHRHPGASLPLVRPLTYDDPAALNKSKERAIVEKLEVARRQLGTALALFLENGDPVSVRDHVSGDMPRLGSMHLGLLGIRFVMPGRRCLQS